MTEASVPAAAATMPSFEPGALWQVSEATTGPDDEAARALGHVDSDGQVLPHGTMIRQRYFRITTLEMDGKPPVLVLTDNDGAFATFDWDAAHDRFVQASRDFSVHIHANEELVYGPSKTTYKVPSDYIAKRSPSLVLERTGPTTGSTSGIRISTATRHSADGPSGPDDPGTLPEDTLLHRLPQLPTPSTLKYSAATKQLKWSLGADDSAALTLLQCYVQPRVAKAPSSDQSWGYVFKPGKDSRLTFPFAGFHPGKVNAIDNAAHGYLNNTGTVPTDSDHQQFSSGRRLFVFPSKESGDWVQAQDAEAQPYLPLGLGVEQLDTHEEDTHTTIFSSVAEQASSWAVTIGGGGGIEGLLTVSAEGTYRDKIDQQLKTENRSVHASIWTFSHRLNLDVPQLQLDSGFLTEVYDLLFKLMSGSREEFSNSLKEFVITNGSHYCHSMTLGTLRRSETQMSLRAETSAAEHKVDVKAEAKAGIEGISVDAKDHIAHEWSDKNVCEISAEDINVFEVGEKSPSAIFFDLRPITELLCPIFFPSSAKDGLDEVAPIIWWDLRDRLTDYLLQVGVGAPIPPELGLDTTPNLIHVSVTEVSLFADGVGNQTSLGGTAVSIDLTVDGVETDTLVNLVSTPFSKTAELLHAGETGTGYPVGYVLASSEIALRPKAVTRTNNSETVTLRAHGTVQFAVLPMGISDPVSFEQTSNVALDGTPTSMVIDVVPAAAASHSFAPAHRLTITMTAVHAGSL